MYRYVVCVICSSSDSQSWICEECTIESNLKIRIDDNYPTRYWFWDESKNWVMLTTCGKLFLTRWTLVARNYEPWTMKIKTDWVLTLLYTIFSPSLKLRCNRNDYFPSHKTLTRNSMMTTWQLMGYLQLFWWVAKVGYLVHCGGIAWLYHVTFLH